VTAVETPPSEPTQPDPEPRRCPRCGTTLRDEQEWCLHCGAGVGARVAEPRGWKWPLAIVGGLLVVVVAALALALVELAGDAEQVDRPTAATPTAAAQPTPAPTAAPTTTDPSQIPPASGGTATTPQVSDWPAGKTGYTVLLDSAATRSAADARAKDLAAQGVPVGVLDSSSYQSVGPNRYVVFSGQYESRSEARVALRGLRNQIDGARIARIAPA
jgi:septal ring-binding cell division protein DamX